MKNYKYQNTLIGKKQLRNLLGWSFTNYSSTQACLLADELKFLGFNYATQAGISISIEDLKVPFIKNLMLIAANEEIINSEKIFLKGKITEVERFQKIIDTWSLTSESLKEQVIHFFKKYDPLNSVYVMAFSGARGNLSQVRQLVGMRGLMSDPSGEILNLPIKKNFREGLTITDYLMSGYGARKGIVDTALKTANSGYLTRRLIDVAQDIIIREKDCLTNHSIRINWKKNTHLPNKFIGRILNQPLLNLASNSIVATKNTQLTSNLIKKIEEAEIREIFIRSPLTCKLYRAVCQQCYGWDLSTENLVDMGEAIGILAGQSIGEPGTQLTMRTFHTGGVFTSETRDQISSPISGILRFSKFLETVTIRTSRGEDVLLTKNSGTLVLIPDNKAQKLIKIAIGQNAILFPKNNQYIQKDTVIAELIKRNQQIKFEIKPILTKNSGEIFIPRIKSKTNILNQNKLIWFLSGQLYNSPKNSFVNFYSDYKINSNSYIFRTKIINNYSSLINYVNNNRPLYQRKVSLTKNILTLSSVNFYQIPNKPKINTYILKFGRMFYSVQTRIKNDKIYLLRSRTDQFAKLLTNKYKTQTGGKIYFNTRSLNSSFSNQIKIYFYDNINNLRSFKGERKQFELLHQTIVWKSEETYLLNCEENILLVRHEDYISKNFELIPDYFSKTSGVVEVNKANNLISQIIIKTGLLYKINKNEIKKCDKKLLYPGELIKSSIILKAPSLCEQIERSHAKYFLIRSLQIYEFPRKTPCQILFENNLTIEENLKFNYCSKQVIKTNKGINLLSKILKIKIPRTFNTNKTIEIVNYQNQGFTIFRLIKDLQFNNHILSTLKYKNILSAVLIQKNQFIDKYTNISYLESLTLNSIEIVKFKTNQQYIKQILLVTNEDCVDISKTSNVSKTFNNLIINGNNVDQIGKILIENQKYFTVQKGRPYFFPNCSIDEYFLDKNLKYLLLPSNKMTFHISNLRKIHLNTKNIFNISSLNCLPSFSTRYRDKTSINFRFKFELSKLFMKNYGRLYSCLIPRFLTTFQITSSYSLNYKINSILEFKYETRDRKNEFPLECTLLFKNLNSLLNLQKKNSKYDFTFVKFLEFPLRRSTKSIGLYSISRDFFEHEVNSVFCKHNEFLDDSSTLGLLNLEKEVTGDIVQGLPRIEEILEARKKKQLLKRLPLNQKKQLLIQKTSIDLDFVFRKLGTPLKKTEKVNPHKLLKVYFNYYGLKKPFFCDFKKIVTFIRLANNFEGCYKSFKKVQTFILKSVQGVYNSQGVTINDKHLEIIIRQMTTKVIISNEGDSPLLKCEVIDLYHVEHINKILKNNNKKCAYYFPLVLGITKAALNNPSFISAASFQETTRVLTKAAIEGRVDWLRGLKENIIIGRLIPAGTGRSSYKTAFKKLQSSYSFLN